MSTSAPTWSIVVGFCNVYLKLKVVCKKANPEKKKGYFAFVFLKKS